MATCDVCGIDDASAFAPALGARSGAFPTLDCALHTLAPYCNHGGGEGIAVRV